MRLSGERPLLLFRLGMLMNPSCNRLSLRQATRRVTQLCDQALAPLDLRATQLSMLREIDRLGPIALNPLAEDRCPLVACDRPAGDGRRELLDVADEPRHQPGPSRLASRLDRPRSVDVLRAGRASAARFGVLVGRRQVLLVGIDDEHSKQARGLSVAGIFADAVMVARHFGKAVANALNFLRSVIDLASYRALQDRP